VRGDGQFKKPADSNPVAEMAHEELEGGIGSASRGDQQRSGLQRAELVMAVKKSWNRSCRR